MRDDTSAHTWTLVCVCTSSLRESPLPTPGKSIIARGRRVCDRTHTSFRSFVRSFVLEQYTNSTQSGTEADNSVYCLCTTPVLVGGGPNG